MLHRMHFWFRKWGELDWPPPFGRAAYPEEALIRDMDGRTGASLKLTILNDAPLKGYIQALYDIYGIYVRVSLGSTRLRTSYIIIITMMRIYIHICICTYLHIHVDPQSPRRRAACGPWWRAAAPAWSTRTPWRTTAWATSWRTTASTAARRARRRPSCTRRRC